ncbi:MAG TPA: PTS ascorbate transporter subunit IIC [Anaerolineae bacterium]|nr:PTS ascorbate transporter subunit IIC [Anaerolineae bacterium]
MQGIVDLIMKDIVGQPAILVGLIATLGLILQGKAFADILAGGVKTTVGYLIITGGAGMVVGVLLNALSPLIQSAFGLVAPAAEAGGIGYARFLAEWAGYATAAVALGFVINLLLARITPFKYIYLTGHLMIFFAENVFIAFLVGWPSISPGTLVVITGVICGVYWTLQPAYMQKLMKGVTGTDDLAFGHTSSFNCWLAAKLGKFVGSPEESAEDIELPESLEFFKDTTVSLGFVLGLVTFVVALIAGPSAAGELSGGQNYIVWALVQGLTFGAGISVMLYGVRMIIGELVPAFRGIAKKLVPGAKPALDCPIVFPYAPTAVLLGFVGAFASFMVWMFVFGAVGWGVIIPPMIMLFFPGGAGGVFGNSTGGWKGAILGGVICGTLLAFGQLILGFALQATVPFYAMEADPDVHILDWIFVQVSKIFGG